jgi:amino acid adenylation domain-containing protein
MGAKTTANPFPLTLNQEQVWTHQQWVPNASLYNLCYSFSMEGQVQTAVLQLAFQQLINRRDSLRGVIRLNQGQPEQLLLESLTFNLPVEHISVAGGESSEAFRQRLQRWSRRRLDLTQRNFDAVLFDLNAAQHVLVINQHHVFSDGWSIGLLFNELCALYEALLSDLPARPPNELYATALGDHQSYRASRSHADDHKFWSEYLSELPPQPALYGQTAHAHDLPSPRRWIPFGNARLERLQALLGSSFFEGQAEDSMVATLFATWLSVLLSRISDSTAFVIGLTHHGRDAHQRETSGYFSQQIPVKLNLQPGDGFDRVFDALREQAQVTLRHRRAAAPPGGGRGFDAIVNYHPRQGFSSLGGLPVNAEWLHPEFGRVPLVLTILPGGGPNAPELRLALDFRQDLFDAAQQERAIHHFLNVVDAFFADPTQAVDGFPILTERETAFIFQAGSGPQLPPHPASVLASFEHQVRTQSDRIAIEAGSERWTYNQLSVQASSVAAQLHRQGIEAGDRVALLHSRCPAAVAGMLGIWFSGGVYVPLDRSLPINRQRDLIKQANARFVISDLDLDPHVLGDTFKVSPDPDAVHQPKIAAKPDKSDPACIFFTSGTSGTPKGVLISHRALAAHIAGAGQQYHIQAADRVLQFASFGFDTSLEQTLTALLSGARLIMRQDDMWTPPRLREAVQHYGITVANLATTYWRQVWAHWQLNPEPESLGSMRLWLIGGEALPADLAEAWRRSGAIPGELWNVYGPTEALITSTAHAVAEMGLISETTPIGRPLPGRQVSIRNRQGARVPPGVPGEMWLGGSALADGYLNGAGPELFVDDIEQTRWYQTGDRARWRPDGTIDFLGRLDDQIKIRGIRVEPAEIAHWLRRHPQVQDAVVLSAGTADRRSLRARVVQKGDALSQTSLLDFLRANLPEVMVPTEIAMVTELVATPHGKLDPGQPTELRAYPSPQTGDPLSQQLVGIWQQVLGRPGIAAQDNFFDVGGNSLLALELFTKIEAATGVRLSPNTLFVAPTIRLLASRIRSRHPGANPLLIPIETSGSAAPFYCIHGFGGDLLGYSGLARGMSPDQPFYGVRASGLEPGEHPDETIEAMGARYLAAIRSHQPEGPYHLGGYCFGGVVAFEMARQLEAAGQPAGLLAIIEGYAPVRRAATAIWRNPRAALFFGRNLWYLAADKWRYRGRNGHPDSSVSKLPVWRQDLLRRHLRALENYVPGDYHGPAALFQVRRSSVRHGAFPRRGWDRIIHGELSEHTLQGAHFNFLEVPHVDSLIAELRQALALFRSKQPQN